MQRKIIIIFVSMLLIGTTNLALADWEPGDGHKMHFPQLPDPLGWDVDFHDMWLGDDWQCSATGTVEDIHFWISWRMDMVIEPIPWIKVWICSDNPGPPYSQPLEVLWTQEFVEPDFLVAGPFTGDQGYYYHSMGEYWTHDNMMYYQINIMNITEPFIQTEGEIYWLVIQMPLFEYPFPAVGWKTSQDHWNDNAVWGFLPGDWFPLDDPITGEPLDFAFVITGIDLPPPVPNVACDGDLTWTKAKAGGTVTETFNVSNIGDPGSELDWDITEWPTWGTWSFNPPSGTNLKPEDGPVTVQVTVVVPKGEALMTPHSQDETYTGQVKIVNLDDTTDFCTIDVSLTTPMNKPFTFNLNLLDWLFDRFPNAFPVLRYILEL